MYMTYSVFIEEICKVIVISLITLIDPIPSICKHLQIPASLIVEFTCTCNIDFKLN